MRPKLLVRFAFALALYLVVEGLTLAGLQVLRKVRGLTYFPTGSTLAPEARTNLDAFLARGKGAQVRMDAVLGWVPQPGSEINAAGMRDDRDYDPQPAPGILRISAFGDSFTYGADVKLGENWAKRISAMKPPIEVLNYGVGAYGLDQAYLRYLQVGADYHPQVVFIGYMTENLARDVNVFRGFYTSFYRNAIFSKPRFRVENGALVLVPNPLATLDDYRRLRDNEEEVLSQLGRNDYHYVGQYRAGPLDFSPSVRFGKMVAARIRTARQIPIFTADGRYEQRSEAYEVTVRIFDAFYRTVLDDGALPIIVVLPDLNDQQRSREGEPRRYAPLLEYFRSRGYRYIDALGALEPVQQRYTMSEISAVKWGHFSKLGNDIVAQYILESLVKWDLDEAPKANAAAVSERQRFGFNSAARAAASRQP
jgi:hypothetical protein